MPRSECSQIENGINVALFVSETLAVWWICQAVTARWLLGAYAWVCGWPSLPSMTQAMLRAIDVEHHHSKDLAGG